MRLFYWCPAWTDSRERETDNIILETATARTFSVDRQNTGFALSVAASHYSDFSRMIRYKSQSKWVFNSLRYAFSGQLLFLGLFDQHDLPALMAPITRTIKRAPAYQMAWEGIDQVI